MVTLLRLAACSVPLLIGLTSRCFVPQFAIVALLRYRLQVSFAHWTSASPVSRTARGEAPSHRRRPSCASSIRNGRPAAPDGLQFSFAHWAYFGLFRALRAAFVRFLNSAWSSRCAHKLACGTPCFIGLTSRCFAHRARASCAPRHCHPYQFPLKSYGFPGAETARKRFLLWKMGFSAAKIAPPPPCTPPGTIAPRKGFGPLALS